MDDPLASQKMDRSLSAPVGWAYHQVKSEAEVLREGRTSTSLEKAGSTAGCFIEESSAISRLHYSL